MASRVQSGTDDRGGVGNAIVTLDVTSGNLLVAVLSERSGDSADDHSVTDSTNTWTKRISMTTEQGDTNARRSFTVWTTTAGATETLNVLGNFTGTPSQDKRLSVHEFTHGGTEDEWTFLDSSSADTGTGSTSPLSTGSTGTVTGASFLAIGCAMWRTQGTDIDSTPIAWTDSLSDEVTHGAGAANARCHSMAHKTSTSTSAYSSSVSWNGTGHEGNAAILVIRTEAGGTTHQGSAALSVSVTSGGGASTRIVHGQAALSSALTLSNAAPRAVYKGQSALASSVALSATGNKLAVSGTVDPMTVSVALAAAGHHIGTGQAALSSSITLASTGHHTGVGDSALSVTISVSASGQVPGVRNTDSPFWAGTIPDKYRQNAKKFWKDRRNNHRTQREV